ncbi:MAG: hypothetical protein RLZZ612_1950 [Pseudomonadota bacterium]|jgi:hypothetical protein
MLLQWIEDHPIERLVLVKKARCGEPLAGQACSVLLLLHDLFERDSLCVACLNVSQPLLCQIEVFQIVQMLNNGFLSVKEFGFAGRCR